MQSDPTNRKPKSAQTNLWCLETYSMLPLFIKSSYSSIALAMLQGDVTHTLTVGLSATAVKIKWKDNGIDLCLVNGQGHTIFSQQSMEHYISIIDLKYNLYKYMMLCKIICSLLFQ